MKEIDKLQILYKLSIIHNAKKSGKTYCFEGTNLNINYTAFRGKIEF